jgi:hypothetical protein
MPTRPLRLLRIVVHAAVLSLPLSAALPAGHAAADAAPSATQWRDLNYQVPGGSWQIVEPDPTSDAASTQLLLSEQEPLHVISLSVSSMDAPPALAPSEVATKRFADRRARTRPDGAYSDFKTDTRTIGGLSYPTSSVRFTPKDGPPIADTVELLIFPQDYGQRQRWFVVRWSDVHSGTTGPKALDELDSFVSKLGVVPLGSVLLSDDFSDPANGALGLVTSSEHYDVAYKDGQLAIQKNDPNSSAIFVVGLPGEYADTSLSADTHMTGSDFGSVEHLFCRHSSDGSYRLDVDQSDGSARLMRIDYIGDTTDELVTWTQSPAIKLGPASNHLELVCRGTSIQFNANDMKVFAVDDDVLEEGQAALGVGAFDDPDAIDEVRFANLVLVER